MMNVNAKASELVALCAAINPVSQGVGTLTTGWIAAKDYHRFLGVITAGVLGAAATLDAKFQQAQDSGGTGAKDVTGRAITQLVKATDDGKASEIDLKHGDLDVKNNFTHIRLSMTVGAAASLTSGHVFGVGPVLAPASDNDGALVKEIV